MYVFILLIIIILIFSIINTRIHIFGTKESFTYLSRPFDPISTDCIQKPLCGSPPTDLPTAGYPNEYNGQPKAYNEKTYVSIEPMDAKFDI